MSDMPGYYSATFAGATTDQIGDKKTPFLLLMFNITKQAINQQWQDMQQPIDRSVRFCLSDGVWANPTAKRILCENLAKLGFNGDYNNPQFTSELIQGAVTLEAVADGEYTNWQIDGLGGPREKKPVSTDLARTLNAKYNAAVATMATPTGAPQPPEAQPAPPMGGPQHDPANGYGPGETPPIAPPAGFNPDEPPF